MKIKSVSKESITFDNGNVISYMGKIIPDFYDVIDGKGCLEKEYPENLYFEKRNYGFAFGFKDGWKTYISCYTEDGDETRDYPDILYKEKPVFNY